MNADANVKGAALFRDSGAMFAPTVSFRRVFARGYYSKVLGHVQPGHRFAAQRNHVIDGVQAARDLRHYLREVILPFHFR
jgi:hypothetical protein